MPALNLDAIIAAQESNSKLLEKVTQKIMSKKQGHHIGAVENMAWLGIGQYAVETKNKKGIAVKLINNTKQFPAFHKLERLARLKSKCRIVASNPEDQALIENIWNTENLVFHVKDKGQLEEGATFCCWVETLDGQQLCGYEESQLGKHFTTVDESVLNRVGPEDRKILLFRVMQVFLNNFAYTLPTSSLWDLQGKMEQFCPFASKKFKSDLLDWAILWADLAFNLSLPPQNKEYKLLEQLLSVTHALAALGRFEDTAFLETEISEKFVQDLAGDSIVLGARANILLTASESFCLVGKEKEALSSLVKHLKTKVSTKGEDVDLSGPSYRGPFYGIVTSYYVGLVKTMHKHRVSTGNSNLHHSADCFEALGALALLTTVSPELGKSAPYYYGIPAYVNFASHLKHEYHSLAYTKNALLKVLQSGSLKEYKALFTNCMDRTKPFHIQLKSFESYYQDATTSVRKDVSNAIKSVHGKLQCSPTCSSCLNKYGKYLCPCLQVRYCSTGCQYKDFPCHKSKCPYLREKKANNKNQAKNV